MNKSIKYTIFSAIFIIVLLSSCRTDNDKFDSRLLYDKCRSEQRNDLCKAVKYTAENIENKYSILHNEEAISYATVYDKDVIDADELWNDIVLADSVWQNTPWRASYDKGVFYEYILPYRIYKEPLDIGWREQAFADFSHTVKSDEPIEVFKKIVRRVKHSRNNEDRNSELLTYREYRDNPQNDCEGRSLYTTMIMRAVGLPVAMDFVPIWGNVNSGHTFITLMLPNGKTRSLPNIEDQCTDSLLNWKCTKIYRRTFAVQRNTLAYKYRDKEPLPPLFSNHDIRDVTSEFDIPQRNIVLSQTVEPIANRHLAYLAVPQRNRWGVVAIGQRKGNRLMFENIGYGYQNGISLSDKGESLGNGALYMPYQYNDANELVPIAPPFIVTSDSIRYLVADTTSTRRMTLSRKYPRYDRIIKFASSTVGYIFEGANRADFSDAEKLYTITETPLSRPQRFHISSDKRYKYIRVRSRRGGLSIGEPSVINNNDTKIKGKIIAHEIISDDHSVALMADDDPLTYMAIEGNFYNLWVGLQFDKPTAIKDIEFCPRTDDNDIKPGDLYELFYWNNGWKSLGQQIANGYSLTFDNVPQNALLLLQNLSRGKEERPFTYENERQIWW